MGLNLKEGIAIDGIYKKNNTNQYVNVKVLNIDLSNNTIEYMINYFISEEDRLAGALPEQTKTIKENINETINTLVQDIMKEIYTNLKASDEFSENFIDS